MPVISGFTDGHSPVLGAPERDVSEVSKLDFMTLLVAQIQNQDPMSPMDNAEFTAQLTQFTTLEEMQAIGSKLDENIMMSQSLNNTAMLALVGKDVTVEGNQIWVENGEVSPVKVSTTAVGTATVSIMDKNGAVVETYTAPVEPGMNDIPWRGVDESGDPVADGNYSFSVSVTNQEGTTVDAIGLMTGPVDALRYENNIAVVAVGSAEYYVAEIYQVSE